MNARIVGKIATVGLTCTRCNVSITRAVLIGSAAQVICPRCLQEYTVKLLITECKEAANVNDPNLQGQGT